MLKDSHDVRKSMDFRARLSAFIQERHKTHAAKRVARDLYRAAGTNVPVGTVYKWISAESFPSGERLTDLLITYPGLALALYGDVVDHARRARKAKLKTLIAEAEAELEGVY